MIENFLRGASLLLLFSLPLVCIAQNAGSCAPIHIVAARATGEAPGPGIISSLAENVIKAMPGTTMEAITYPASLPYSGSLPKGVIAMKEAIANTTQRCPQTKLVLMGYSQGGAVTTDTLCGGGGGEVGPATPGVTTQQGKNVVAAVSMGDPRFVPGTAYDVGTGKKGGLIARDKTVAQCPSFAARLVSYCNDGDSRCDSGNNLLTHLSYTQVYGKQALAFVMGKLNGETSSTENGTLGTTSSAGGRAGQSSGSARASASARPSASARASAAAASNEASTQDVNMLFALLMQAPWMVAHFAV